MHKIMLLELFDFHDLFSAAFKTFWKTHLFRLCFDALFIYPQFLTVLQAFGDHFKPWGIPNQARKVVQKSCSRIHCYVYRSIDQLICGGAQGMAAVSCFGRSLLFWPSQTLLRSADPVPTSSISRHHRRMKVLIHNCIIRSFAQRGVLQVHAPQNVSIRSRLFQLDHSLLPQISFI
jgi:hypothetical protein